MNVFVDGHCHLYAFSDNEIDEILKEFDIVIIAISEDIESSLRTLSLGKRDERIKPCIGIHPWNVKGEETLNQVDILLENISKAKCIGEVGLDKRFNKENYAWQEEAFYKFVEASIKNKKPINIHALDAWKDALEIVSSMGVKKAIFHWYSGPIDLLRKIQENGYYITINPSVEVQKKHGRALENAPLEILITESDGPYNYKGRKLHPRMIPWLVEYIAERKNVSKNYVTKVVSENFKRYFNW